MLANSSTESFHEHYMDITTRKPVEVLTVRRVRHITFASSWRPARTGNEHGAKLSWGTASGRATWDGWRGRFQTGLPPRSGVRHPSAARTSLLSPRALAGLKRAQGGQHGYPLCRQ